MSTPDPNPARTWLRILFELRLRILLRPKVHSGSVIISGTHAKCAVECGFPKKCFEDTIFDCGSIICDNCSESDKHLLDKAQISAAKIILGCLKTTSSSDVLLDLNLKTLNHRREISIIRYFSKKNFRLVPCPFAMNLFRWFSEFVPYTLRHNLYVQISLSKKSLAFNFFLRKACSLWNLSPVALMEFSPPEAHGILSPCSLWNSLPL